MIYVKILQKLWNAVVVSDVIITIIVVVMIIDGISCAATFGSHPLIFSAASGSGPLLQKTLCPSTPLQTVERTSSTNANYIPYHEIWR